MTGFRLMDLNFFLQAAMAVLLSCSGHQGNGVGEANEPQRIISFALQDVLDRAGVNGTILVLDHRENKFFANDFEAVETGSLPASTFKIPNTIIGLETGFATDQGLIFHWDGEKRSLSQWERDMNLREAFHLSCVPCYQQLARDIGPERMNEFLRGLDYGQMDVQDGNIDEFWLRGHSTISPMQQIDFLKRFYFSELPVSENTTEIMKQLVVIEEVPSYRLSGKTGWAIRDGQNTGWFTGYIETGNQVYFFCTRIRPTASFNMDMFHMIRRDITMEALRALGIITD